MARQPKLIIDYSPKDEREILLKDIAEGFVKGNHTVDEFLDLMEEVCRSAHATSE